MYLALFDTKDIPFRNVGKMGKNQGDAETCLEKSRIDLPPLSMDLGEGGDGQRAGEGGLIPTTCRLRADKGRPVGVGEGWGEGGGTKGSLPQRAPSPEPGPGGWGQRLGDREGMGLKSQVGFLAFLTPSRSSLGEAL